MDVGIPENDLLPRNSWQPAVSWSKSWRTPGLAEVDHACTAHLALASKLKAGFKILTTPWIIQEPTMGSTFC